MLLAESLTEQVIGPAIEVHRNTGPGLLEAVHEQRLYVELRRAAVGFARQVPIPMLHKGEQVGDGFKADVVVAQQLILEIKSVATVRREIGAAPTAARCRSNQSGKAA